MPPTAVGAGADTLGGAGGGDATLGAGGDATLGGAATLEADVTLGAGGDATLGDAGAGLPKIIPILICLSKISLVVYFSPLHTFV